jgi:hypothetical protein
MQYTLFDLPERAWISRLWAQFNKLPKSYKKVFLGIAKSLALEAGRQEELVKRENEKVSFSDRH